MNCLLDTDICVFIIKGKSPAALKMVQSKPPEEIAVSAITRAELEYGVVLVTNNEREFKRVQGLRVENWAKASVYDEHRRTASRLVRGCILNGRLRQPVCSVPVRAYLQFISGLRKCER